MPRCPRIVQQPFPSPVQAAPHPKIDWFNASKKTLNLTVMVYKYHVGAQLLYSHYFFVYSIVYSL